jgi:hypothetical protein
MGADQKVKLVNNALDDAIMAIDIAKLVFK